MNVRARSQTFNPGELPLVLLALAETESLKAYEFLAELDRLFGPEYKPSPGGVYPALTALTAEKLLATTRDGRAKRYELTATGRQALEKRRRNLSALEERTGVRLRDDGSLRSALDGFAQRVLKLSGHIDPDAAGRILERAAEQIERLNNKGASDDGKR